jgi:hypothetical protein
VILPFIPEFVIITTSLVAEWSGCRASDNSACVFRWGGESKTASESTSAGQSKSSSDIKSADEPKPAAEPKSADESRSDGKSKQVDDSGSAGGIIRDALEAGTTVGHRFSEGLAAVWLIVCCILVTRGWTGLSSRLLLVFVLSVICAFAPYFGPMLSIDHLKNANCGVDKSGLPCRIYGSNLTDAAYGAVDLGEQILEGAGIVLAVFVSYLVLAIVMHVRASRRVAGPAH